MQPHEQAQFLKAIGSFITAQVRAASLPLLEKIDALEKQIAASRAEPVTEQQVKGLVRSVVSEIQPALIDTCKDWAVGTVMKLREDGEIKDGKDGKDVDLVLVRETIELMVEGHVKTITGPDVEEIVKELDKQGIVQAVAALMPTPKDGEDGKPGKDGEDGEDGKSVELSDILPVLADLIGKAVADLPIPASVAGGFIDRSGHLFLTFTDGSNKDLGLVVGKDGDPGAPGKDGLGFKDMTAVWDGERTLTLKFQLDDRVEELSIKLPYQFYRGVWKEGRYEQGDSVTRARSTWIAIRDTDGRPGDIDSGWVMSAKKGNDGDDGKPGPPGPPGEPGRDGKDLTQMTFAGEKY